MDELNEHAARVAGAAANIEGPPSSLTGSPAGSARARSGAAPSGALGEATDRVFALWRDALHARRREADSARAALCAMAAALRGVAEAYPAVDARAASRLDATTSRAGSRLDATTPRAAGAPDPRPAPPDHVGSAAPPPFDHDSPGTLGPWGR